MLNKVYKVTLTFTYENEIQQYRNSSKKIYNDNKLETNNISQQLY